MDSSPTFFWGDSASISSRRASGSSVSVHLGVRAALDALPDGVEFVLAIGAAPAPIEADVMEKLVLKVGPADPILAALQKAFKLIDDGIAEGGVIVVSEDGEEEAGRLGDGAAGRQIRGCAGAGGQGAAERDAQREFREAAQSLGDVEGISWRARVDVVPS